MESNVTTQQIDAAHEFHVTCRGNALFAAYMCKLHFLPTLSPSDSVIFSDDFPNILFTHHTWSNQIAGGYTTGTHQGPGGLLGLGLLSNIKSLFLTNFLFPPHFFLLIVCFAHVGQKLRKQNKVETQKLLGPNLTPALIFLSAFLPHAAI